MCADVNDVTDVIDYLDDIDRFQENVRKYRTNWISLDHSDRHWRGKSQINKKN